MALIKTVVTTTAQLRALSSVAAGDELLAVIDGMIPLTKPVVSLFAKLVHLVIARPGCGIEWTDRFNGNWSDPSEVGSNGIDWNRNVGSFTAEGLILKGFNRQGSALKMQFDPSQPRNADVNLIDVEFEDVGTLQSKKVSGNPADSSEVIYTSCLGSHGKTGTRVNAHGVKFRSSSRNAHFWSHLLYVESEVFRARDCHALDCGSMFSLGGADVMDAFIAGCTWRRPAAAVPTWYDGQLLRAYFMDASANVRGTVTRNVISCGNDKRPTTIFSGQMDPAKLQMIRNTYTGSVPAQFAANTQLGVYYTFPEWKGLGFDLDAKLAPGAP